MIGYNRNSYNCAHHAINRINSIHGLSIRFDDSDCWQGEFIPMLRQYFRPIKRPENNCLAVMTQSDSSLHLGVYNNHSIEHNYQPRSGAGCVIISDMGTIRSLYKRIRYYAVN